MPAAVVNPAPLSYFYVFLFFQERSCVSSRRPCVIRHKGVSHETALRFVFQSVCVGVCVVCLCGVDFQTCSYE